MGDERSSLVQKAISMKKAGVPTVATLAVLLLSTPGFWEFFFDKTDDEAKAQAAQSEAKAEVAYELLKKEMEHQSEANDQLREEVRDLRLFMRSYIMGGVMLVEGAGEFPEPPPPPAPPISVGVSKPTSGAMDSSAPVELMDPEELFDDGDGDGVPDMLKEPEPTPQMEQKALPPSLDDKSLLGKIKEKVSKK